LRHFRIKTTDFIWKYDDINVESSIPLNLIENILENMKCFVKQA
jgi:hypothetical protein